MIVIIGAVGNGKNDGIYPEKIKHIYAELRADSEALAIYEDKPASKKRPKPIAKSVSPKFILATLRKRDKRTS